jgi:RHS repeat-associated protein
MPTASRNWLVILNRSSKHNSGISTLSIPASMEVEYILSDHLGSSSLTTDKYGNKVSEIRYKPWGEIRSYTVTPPANAEDPDYYQMTRYTFTGQYSHVTGFGLMFYNARWYDSSLGRFAQADTIIPGGVQGYDRYAYAFNNPVRYNDPSGHKPCGDGEKWGCGTGKKQDPDKEPYPNWRKHVEKDKPRNGLPTTPYEGPCVSLVCLPTSTLQPTLPTATPTAYNGPAYETSAPPSPYLEINVDIVLSKGDWVDVAIDGITVVADFVTIGALVTGDLPVAAGAEIAGDIVGAVGVVKGGYDIYKNSDASGLASAELGWQIGQTERRLAGAIPVIGTVFDVANLYNDLNPKITIQWITP